MNKIKEDRLRYKFIKKDINKRLEENKKQIKKDKAIKELVSLNLKLLTPLKDISYVDFNNRSTSKDDNVTIFRIISATEEIINGNDKTNINGVTWYGRSLQEPYNVMMKEVNKQYKKFIREWKGL